MVFYKEVDLTGEKLQEHSYRRFQIIRVLFIKSNIRRNMKKAIAVLMIFSVIHGRGLSQTITPAVVNSTGGGFTNDNYSLDWSIGELALVNELRPSNTAYVFNNGFLQPFSLFHRTSGRRFTDKEIRILPNPTRDNLQIDFQTAEPGQMKCMLHDISGQLLYTKEFISTGSIHSEKINMTGFASGSYTLYIFLVTSNNPLQNITGTYKIIKLN